jgi:solute carrier family 25 protein 33/36
MSAIVTCPLEVVKTRLQASGGRSLRASVGSSFFATGSLLRAIARQEGVRGLYSGFVPTLMGVGPTRALHFGAYNAAKRAVEPVLGADTPMTHMTSAACAGMASYTLGNPVWVVKTRLQIQSAEAVSGPASSSSRYKGTLDAFRRIYAEEGIRGYFRGVSASYLGISEGVIQFALYEKFKALVGPRADTDGQLGTALYVVQMGAASGSAKTIASTLTYPHEVLRTRLREQRVPLKADAASVVKYRGLFSTAKVILAEEGARAFYQGLGAHLLRVAPNSIVLFLTYEFVVDRLSS